MHDQFTSASEPAPPFQHLSRAFQQAVLQIISLDGVRKERASAARAAYAGMLCEIVRTRAGMGLLACFRTTRIEFNAEPWNELG